MAVATTANTTSTTAAAPTLALAGPGSAGPAYQTPLNAHATPQNISPSPNVLRVGSPDVRRSLEAAAPARPNVTCLDAACDQYMVEFSSEALYKEHVEKEHDEPRRDPVRFACDNLAAALGLAPDGSFLPDGPHAGADHESEQLHMTVEQLLRPPVESFSHSLTYMGDGTMTYDDVQVPVPPEHEAAAAAAGAAAPTTAAGPDDDTPETRQHSSGPSSSTDTTDATDMQEIDFDMFLYGGLGGIDDSEHLDKDPDHWSGEVYEEPLVPPPGDADFPITFDPQVLEDWDMDIRYLPDWSK
jgi:hypothetical protein